MPHSQHTPAPQSSSQTPTTSSPDCDDNDIVQTPLSKREALVEFCRLGFPLIKLAGKVPVESEKNWVNKPPFPPVFNGVIDTFRDCNYGVVLTDKYLVIDVDPRNFKNGDNPLTRLRTDVGQPLTTFAVRTGSGGLHLFYRKPPEIKIRKKLHAYNGIDFLTRGQFVVGLGSVHPDTSKPYVHLPSQGFVIKQAPLPLLQMLLNTCDNSDATQTASKLVNYADDKQTIDRVVSYLQSAPPAVEGENGDTQTYKTACRCREYGVSPQLATELMLEYWNPRCLPTWGVQELARKVENAYRYDTEILGKNNPVNQFAPVGDAENVLGKDPIARKVTWSFKNPATGSLNVNQHNTLMWLYSPELGLEGVFGYNEFTQYIQFQSQAPWHTDSSRVHTNIKDEDEIALMFYLAEKVNWHVSIEYVRKALVQYAMENSFHPVRSYLNSLQWDGVERLDSWLVRYAGVRDNAYARTIGRIVLCAAVKRIMHPGCKFDYILVLEGQQGIGKSRLVAALGGAWGADVFVDPHSKDTLDMMKGKWIIEASEMEMTRRAETMALKAFISRPTDRVRTPYARHAVDLPRQSVFIGTVNPDATGQYLNDTTGNRRYWPVSIVGEVDVEGLVAVRDQLFAEALYAINHGQKLYIANKQVDMMARIEANERQMAHPWIDEIKEWLEENNKQYTTTKEIYRMVVGGNLREFKRADQSAIVTILKTLGYDEKVVSIGNKKIRRYERNFILTNDNM